MQASIVERNFECASNPTLSCRTSQNYLERPALQQLFANIREGMSRPQSPSLLALLGDDELSAAPAGFLLEFILGNASRWDENA